MLASSAHTVLAFVLTLLLAAAPAHAQVPDCGRMEDLEATAFKAKLTDDQRSCLEDYITAAGPHERTRASFVLITNAFMGGEEDTYSALLKRHLTKVNTSDADVAYMYAILLEKRMESPFERLRWVRVAIENRGQWARQVRVYRDRVKRLYQMRIEAAIETWQIAEQQYNQNPTPANAERVRRYEQRAKYWSQISGACIVYDDCGPEFYVEVVEETACEDLSMLDEPAKVGKLTSKEITCLQGRYERQVLGRSRVMGLLVANADAGQDPSAWERLLSWYFNEYGTHDPAIALRFAQYLAAQGQVYASEVVKWTEIVLKAEAELKSKKAKGILGEAHLLRVRAGKQLVDDAELANVRASSPETQSQLDAAKGKLASYRKEMASYCTGAGDCPAEWTSEAP